MKLFTTTMAAAASVLALAAPASAAQPAVHHYSTKQGAVTAANVFDKTTIPGASKAFRTFLKAELRTNWKKEQHGVPACKDTGVIGVRGLRTDGYAMAALGTNMTADCHESVSGRVELYAVRHGQWKRVFAGEDIPTCAKLEKLDFPSAVGVHSCIDASGATVTWKNA
jgi:hypothetical protein